MKIIKKRRREQKTDYKRRLSLLKSGRPRIVFRKTNAYIIAQYTVSTEAQDKVVFSLTSKTLLHHGWPKEMSGSLKSLPATYLTGFLFAKQIPQKDHPIVDAGMTRTIHKNAFYAFLKGLIDGGVNISCKKEAFPEEERIQGKKLKTDFSAHFKKIKQTLEQ